jgi:hypothetical protein
MNSLQLLSMRDEMAKLARGENIPLTDVGRVERLKYGLSDTPGLKGTARAAPAAPRPSMRVGSALNTPEAKRQAKQTAKFLGAPGASAEPKPRPKARARKVKPKPTKSGRAARGAGKAAKSGGKLLRRAGIIGALGAAGLGAGGALAYRKQKGKWPGAGRPPQEWKVKQSFALGGGQLHGAVQRGAEEVVRGAGRAVKSKVRGAKRAVKKRLGKAIRKAMETEVAIA